MGKGHAPGMEVGCGASVSGAVTGVSAPVTGIETLTGRSRPAVFFARDFLAAGFFAGNGLVLGFFAGDAFLAAFFAANFLPAGRAALRDAALRAGAFLRAAVDLLAAVLRLCAAAFFWTILRFFAFAIVLSCLSQRYRTTGTRQSLHVRCGRAGRPRDADDVPLDFTRDSAAIATTAKPTGLCSPGRGKALPGPS